ncbi:MAG: hypothetical protein PHW95_05575, partial [Patescibacteria group bacterium]|nr:hypothetical protein [Patescibacteria group bacterium]
ASKNTFEESFTLDATNMTADGYIFYVKSLKNPIDALSNQSQVKVSVYFPDFTANKDSYFSKPTYTYVLSGAMQSDNPKANLWHVFNVYKSNPVSILDQQVKEMNRIVTDNNIKMDYTATIGQGLQTQTTPTACGAVTSGGVLAQGYLVNVLSPSDPFYNGGNKTTSSMQLYYVAADANASFYSSGPSFPPAAYQNKNYNSNNLQQFQLNTMVSAAPTCSISNPLSNPRYRLVLNKDFTFDQVMDFPVNANSGKSTILLSPVLMKPHIRIIVSDAAFSVYFKVGQNLKQYYNVVCSGLDYFNQPGCGTDGVYFHLHEISPQVDAFTIDPQILTTDTYSVIIKNALGENLSQDNQSNLKVSVYLQQPGETNPNRFSKPYKVVNFNAATGVVSGQWHVLDISKGVSGDVSVVNQLETP